MSALSRAAAGLLAGLALAFTLLSPASAGAIDVGESSVASADPTSITWTIRVNASAGLKSADLNYRVYNPDGNVSGTIHAEVPPGTVLDLTATLPTRSQERYIPVGTRFAYWWTFVDADGVERSTDEQPYVFLDGRYQWQARTEGDVTAFWYGGNDDGATHAIAAAEQSIRSNEALLGVTLPYPITIVVWRNESEGELAQTPRASSFDQQVITGGTRVGTDLVHIYDGLGSFDDVVRHEVAHILTKVAGDGPFTRIPAWLDEGTAVYAQASPGAGYQGGLDRAIQTNTTLRLRDMQSPANRAELVDLFYGEAWSTVKFMIDTHGQAKFAQVFSVVKGGEPIDTALQQVYGVNQDGLYNLWRQSVGLPEVQFTQVEATPLPQPEATRAPLGIPTGSSGAATATPASAGGTPQAQPSPVSASSGSSNAGAAIVIAVIAVLLAGGLGGLGFRLMRSSRR